MGVYGGIHSRFNASAARSSAGLASDLKMVQLPLHRGMARQDAALTFEQLYKVAKKSVPKIEKLAKKKILAELGSRHPGVFTGVTFENGPLKTRARAHDKIRGDYKGNYTEICDLARGRIIVDTVEQIEILRNYFQANRQALGIEEYKDRFAEPSDTGFRDINMKIRLDNDHVIEFRVEHRAMMKAAEATHAPYEKMQEIDRLVKAENRDWTQAERFKRYRILDQVRDIHGFPVQKAGLDQLLSHKGREKVDAFEKSRKNPQLSEKIILYRINTANLDKVLEKLNAVSQAQADKMSKTTRELYALRKDPIGFREHYIALNQIDAMGSVKKDMAQIKLPKTVQAANLFRLATRITVTIAAPADQSNIVVRAERTEPLQMRKKSVQHVLFR